MLRERVSQLPLAKDMDLKTFVSFPDRGLDLYDSLANAAQNDRAYSIPSRDWPDAIQVVAGGVTALPAKVDEEGEMANVVCRLGLLPHADLAWASVDAKFFIWKFGSSGAVLVERETTGIVAHLGLVKPKPGVFTENIKHLLVVCTDAEVSLLGLTFDRYDSSVDIHELTFYTSPLDGRMIQAIAGTKNGRIFMGGLDGVIFELIYSTGAGILWSSPLCRKAAINGSFLTKFMKQKEAGRIQQLVVDDNRRILYSLDAGGRIQAFDLGTQGNSYPRNYAECSEFFNAASKAVSGRDCFSNQNERRVVSLSPVGGNESWRINLMAMTSEGHRVFFTSKKPDSKDWFYGMSRKAQLKAVIVRPAPRLESFVGGTGQPNYLLDRDTPVAHSVSCLGGVIMAVSSNGGDIGTTELVAYLNSQDASTPAADSNQPVGMREDLIRRAFKAEGSAIALGELKEPPSHSALSQLPIPNDELSCQILMPRKRFGLITSRCSVVFEKRWPVDVLALMLAEDNMGAVRGFFKAYGNARAAAMCFQLAASDPHQVQADVVKSATNLLANKFFGGEPKVVSLDKDVDLGADRSMVDVFDTGNGSGIQCSTAFYGLKLYIGRLIEPIWRDHLFKESSTGKLLQCNWPPELIQWYGKRCQAAIAGADVLLARWDSQTVHNGHIVVTSSPPKQFEAKLVNTGRTLLRRIGDVMGFLRVLLSQNVTRITSRLSSEHQKNLKKLNLMGLVVDKGPHPSVDALLSELTSDKQEWSSVVINQLGKEASSLFSRDKKIYLKASREFRLALSSGNSAKQQKIQISNALKLMREVPGEIDLHFVAEGLYGIGYMEDFVSICLHVASAFSPEKHLHSDFGSDMEQISIKRDNCYNMIFRAADTLVAKSRDEGKMSQWSKRLERLLKASMLSKNQTFLWDLFERISKDPYGGTQMILLNSPEVGKFLQKKADLKGKFPLFDTMDDDKARYVLLLAKRHSQQGCYAESAQMYRLLAERTCADGQHTLTLEDRIDLLTQAQNQMCCLGRESEEINDMLTLVGLQKYLRDRIEAIGAGHLPDSLMQPLRSQILAIPTLVDHYAVPQQLYDITLEALSLVGDEIPSDRAGFLWDHYLRSAYRANEDFCELCDAVKGLGKRLSHSQKFFPKAQVIIILEAHLVGLWPDRDGAIEYPEERQKRLILETILGILQNSWPSVLKAYMSCLDYDLAMDFRAHGTPEHIQVQILKSLSVIFEQICGHPFFPEVNGELLSGPSLIKQLEKCIRVAKGIKIAQLETEVETLLDEYEEVRERINSKTQRCRMGARIA